MNTMRLSSRGFAVRCAIFICFLLITSRASASSVDVLNAEFFDGKGFPPSGWVDDSYSYWYQSANGQGGSNGSAVMDFWDCGNATLYSPTVDASPYVYTSDTTYVEFDLWMEADFYSINNGGDQLTVSAQNSNGSTQLLLLNSSVDYTYDNSSSYGYLSDPDMDPSYWRHYKLGIPASMRTSDLQILWSGSTPNGACGGQAAIDNVVITGEHYNVLSVLPNAITFAGTSVGDTSGAQSILLQNPNPVDINISNLMIGGSNPGDFLLLNAPTVLTAGTIDNPTKASIVLKFNPQQGGTRNAIVSFNTDADAPTYAIVTLTGQGLTPTVTLGSTSLFTKTHIKLGDTIQQCVQITNSGVGKLNISNGSFISGDYPAEYAIVRIPSAEIPPGQSDTMCVIYTPTMEGSHTAVLNVVSNASNDTVRLPLNGIGILPRLIITPAMVDFNNVPVGNRSCQSITFYNAGSDTLAIKNSYFASADADFSYTGLENFDSLIPPGITRTVQVCFTPIRSGTRVARLRVVTNIPMTFDNPRQDTSAFTVNIIGNGVALGKLSVAAATVGDSTLVGTQVCVTDTLFNVGSDALTVTSGTITGTLASEFSLSGVSFPFTIASGSYQLVTVCGTPGARGVRAAQVAFLGSSNGEAENASTTVFVVGLEACASAAPSTLFDGTKTLVGTRDSQMVTVTNCGDFAATYIAALTSTSGAYSLGSLTSAVIAPQGTATFVVYFKPMTRGADAGSITITTPNVSPMTVALGATGASATILASTPVVPKTTVGQTSANFDVTLTNTGNVDWTPGVPTVTGPFTYVSGATTVVPAGGQSTLQFSFTPTQTGTNTATVTFPNSVPTEIPLFTLSLSGEGAAIAAVNGSAVAQGFALGQNYPNPFGASAANAATEISFTLPQDAQVKLVITDMQGNVVRNVLDSRLAAGTHAVRFAASDLASGTYYYTLTASNGQTKLTRQMVLVK
jgi:hypothetical protein